jgi:hypothetical protein
MLTKDEAAEKALRILKAIVNQKKKEENMSRKKYKTIGDYIDYAFVQNEKEKLYRELEIVKEQYHHIICGCSHWPMCFDFCTKFYLKYN